MFFLQSLMGLVCLCAIAWIIGESRNRDAWKPAIIGVSLQLAIAALLIKLPASIQIFDAVNQAFVAVESATREGTSLVFGYLGGAPLPFEERYPGSAFILGLQALPLILVTSALAALLYHLRVLPLIVKAFAWALGRTMGVGGAVGVATAANIFVGMVEAPLFIRPYLLKLSRASLFAIMTCGMATIAGTVFALYVAFLSDVIPNAAGHLLTASLISAPAAITVARLMIQDTDSAEPQSVDLPPSSDRTFIDAVIRGTTEGLNLLLHISAMLIVVVALVALVNSILGLVPDIGGAALTLERALGWIMTPIAWLMGVPWSEASTAGTLLGVKAILNELYAYLQLIELPGDALSERSRVIMTYALSGFANFGSLGIMISGLCTLVPERRNMIIELGLKSVVSGTIATCMTGAVVGVLI